MTNGSKTHNGAKGSATLRHKYSVMKLSLGTAQLGVDYGINNAVGYLTDDQADAVLDAAVDSGFTMVDVSYAYGTASERIGRFLRRRPGALSVVLKVHAALSPEMIRERQAKCRDLIGEVAYTMLWTSGQRIVTLNPRLVDGVSVNTVAEAVAAGVAFSIIQVPASVLDGRMDEVIKRLQSKHRFVQVRSLLLQGLLAAHPKTGPVGRYGRSALPGEAMPYLLALRRLADDFDMSMVELAIRWVWQINPDVAIVGAETPEQVRAIARAWKRGPLPVELVGQVLELRADVPELVISPRMWAQAFDFTTGEG